MNSELDVNKSALLKLLRISVGEFEDLAFSPEVDWDKVFELSLQQGVVAVVLSGINTCRNHATTDLFALDTPEWEDLKYKWMGYGMCYEKDNAQQKRRIGELAHLFSSNGFKMLLLKGYGLSLYYPYPAFRPKGDIDIYMLGGSEALSKKVDSIVSKQLGLPVTKSKLGHHSHYTYDGTLVENHYELSNTYFKGKRSIYLENALKKLAEESPKKYGPCYLPSATFNAVFLIWHLSTHFCSENIRMRQICDWMLFLKHEHDNIDWPCVEEIWKQSGLWTMASIVSGIAIKYLGMPSDYVPNIDRDNQLEQKVLVDIFSEKKESGLLFNRVLRYFKNGWKYRDVIGQGMAIPMFESVVMHLFHPNDLNEVNIFEKK